MSRALFAPWGSLTLVACDVGDEIELPDGATVRVTETEFPVVGDTVYVTHDMYERVRSEFPSGPPRLN